MTLSSSNTTISSDTTVSYLIHELIAYPVFKPLVENDPYTLKPRKKSIILICICLAASVSGFTSTIYFPGLPYITEDLQATSITTTLTAALFILMMGVGSIIWASISDYYQIRRYLFLISTVIFSVSSLGGVFVSNIWTLVVLRCIQALGCSSGISIGAGVIADCYPIEKRGSAFGKFNSGMMFGPLFGPIIGGFLILSKNTWRATFWFCFAFSIFIFFLIFFFLPETYRLNDIWDHLSNEVLPSNSSMTTLNEVELENGKNEKLEKLEKFEGIERTIAQPPYKTEKKNMNPIAAILLLRHPFVLISSIAGGIFFGCMFTLETIIPGQLVEKYNLSSWQIGLSFLGGGVGNIMGSIMGGYLSDYLLLRARRQRGGRAIMEDRLSSNIWLCGIVITPLGTLLFGISLAYNMSIWVNIIAYGINTFGMIQVTSACSAYLVDAMPGLGASASAVSNLIRMIIACILTIITSAMVSALGVGWSSVLLSVMLWVGMALLFILKVKGEKIRAYSGY
ncbi:major facilitator superfamily domain-containing protein [Spinellus fusiger]|nr:major facilitator superfamily domain-containing protein [Spinellus fusiger]